MTATTPLTCDGFANALADYLERDDTPRVRAAVEAHAGSCAACGGLLADLQQLRVDAAGLPTLTPSRDLWAGIAERIETPVIEIGKREVGSGKRERQTNRLVTWLRPMAAAAALVVITAGVTYVAAREAFVGKAQQVAIQPVDSATLDVSALVARAIDSVRRAEGFATAATDPGRASPDADGRQIAPRPSPVAPRSAVDRTPTLLVSAQPPGAVVETVYGREIARLRRIVDERRSQLDTATVGVLERNLNVIDQAIRESRAALARDPASAFLNEQLTNVLEQKVELLRAAALLPVRS